MTARPRFAMTYMVYWRASGVMKVGRAYRSARLGSFVATGAEIIVCVRDTPAVWESAVLVAMRARFPRAFATAHESTNHLSRGRGWTECFRVTPDQIGAAVTLFKKAVAPYAIQPHPEVQARGAEPGRALPDPATTGATVHHEPADVRRLEGSGGGELAHVAGDAVRVRRGRGPVDGRRDADRARGPRVAVAVHRGAAHPHADQPGSALGVRIDGWAGRLPLPATRTRPGGHPESPLGRLRADCGGGEGGRGGAGGGAPVVLRRHSSASAGLQLASEQHRSHQLREVRGCSEDSPAVHGWGDNSRASRSGLERCPR